MVLFSQYFVGKNQNQSSFDFVDINLDSDNKLFLDVLKISDKYFPGYGEQAN